MDLNYQDKNLLVFYLQIFLNEYFGLSVREVTDKSVIEETGSLYEITDQDKIEVTGYLNIQTYTSIALWMAYNNPNEGYPYKWSSEVDAETGELKWKYDVQDYSDTSKVLNVIVNNINAFYSNRECIVVPDRILSYVFNEVVTPQSSPEEVLRAKYLILGDPVVTRYTYTYDDSFMNKVKEIQENFIKRHTINDEYQAPPGFERFHTTGYVDPWTEVIVKGLIS